MPYVNIKITREGNVTPEKKQALIEGATNLLHDVLGKYSRLFISYCNFKLPGVIPCAFF